MLHHICQATSSYHSIKLLESALLNRGPRTFILLRLPTHSIAWRGYSTRSIFPMPQQGFTSPVATLDRRSLIPWSSCSCKRPVVMANSSQDAPFPMAESHVFGQPYMAQHLSPNFLELPSGMCNCIYIHFVDEDTYTEGRQSKLLRDGILIQETLPRILQGCFQTEVVLDTKLGSNPSWKWRTAYTSIPKLASSCST